MANANRSPSNQAAAWRRADRGTIAIVSVGSRGEPSSGAIAQPLEDTLLWLIDIAPEFARDHVRYLFGVVDAMGEFESELFDVFCDSAEANIVRTAKLILRGEGTDTAAVPDETIEFVRHLARRGIPLDDVLRCLRYGYNYLWRRVADRLLEEAGSDSGELVAHWTEQYLRYTNWLGDHTVAIYAEERKRWVRSASAVRAHTVEEILRGDPVDIDTASRRLSYELRRPHIAIVAWVDSGVDVNEALKLLEGSVAAAADAVGGATPLVVNDDISGCWAWVAPRPGRDDRDIVADIAAPGIHLAVGRRGEGIEGFRASHGDALEARRVARLVEGAAAVTHYRSIELTSLMSADVDRARAYVRTRLGPLAEDDPATEVLRDTLLAYLESGNRKLVAASDLSVHHHTVANRLHRIEELLGGPLDAASLIELHTALVLARDLGPQVVGRDESAPL